MKNMQGLSLIELCIGLFLSLLLIIWLNNSFLALFSHYIFLENQAKQLIVMQQLNTILKQQFQVLGFWGTHYLPLKTPLKENHPWVVKNNNHLLNMNNDTVCLLTTSYLSQISGNRINPNEINASEIFSTKQGEILLMQAPLLFRIHRDCWYVMKQNDEGMLMLMHQQDEGVSERVIDQIKRVQWLGWNKKTAIFMPLASFKTWKELAFIRMEIELCTPRIGRGRTYCHTWPMEFSVNVIS